MVHVPWYRLKSEERPSIIEKTKSQNIGNLKIPIGEDYEKNSISTGCSCCPLHDVLDLSAEAPKFGADRHVAHGMACASCHGPDGKSPEYPDQETCLKCHQKDALIEKTKAIGPVNPHKAPHNGECTLCHLQHEAPVNYCAECHPQFKFNPN